MVNTNPLSTIIACTQRQQHSFSGDTNRARRCLWHPARSAYAGPLRAIPQLNQDPKSCESLGASVSCSMLYKQISIIILLSWFAKLHVFSSHPARGQVALRKKSDWKSPETTRTYKNHEESTRMGMGSKDLTLKTQFPFQSTPTEHLTPMIVMTRWRPWCESVVRSRFTAPISTLGAGHAVHFMPRAST